MKLLLLVVCSVIATSFAGPSANKEAKLEAVLSEIEETLQGLRQEDEPVPNKDRLRAVNIQGDIPRLDLAQDKSRRTFNEKMEEVLLHTDDIAKAEKEVKALGGRVTIQLGYDLLAAKVPSHVAASHAFTQSSTHISNSASAATLINARAYWKSREEMLKPQPPVMRWTTVGKSTPQSFPREDVRIQGESPYKSTMSGRICAMVLIPSGPGDLAISDDEKTTILNEVITGLKFWEDKADDEGVDLTPVYHWGSADIEAANPASCTSDDKSVCHNVFADPILEVYSGETGQTGRDKLANHIKTQDNCDGVFLAFFSKYRQNHFAYAYFDGGPSYMQYSNDDWGTDQIDRVFAHEMGHVFNAPDEYTKCNCGKAYGEGTCTDTNDNCYEAGETSCTTSVAQENCIMDYNDINHICDHTKKHVGWC